jgi:hypothetical protein
MQLHTIVSDAVLSGSWLAKQVNHLCQLNAAGLIDLLTGGSMLWACAFDVRELPGD